MRMFLPALMWVGAGLIWGCVLFWPAPYDDTDAGGRRSGMRPHTDALTGCQYLSRLGSLTPRLDASGKQICGVRP